MNVTKLATVRGAKGAVLFFAIVALASGKPGDLHVCKNVKATVNAQGKTVYKGDYYINNQEQKGGCFSASPGGWETVEAHLTNPSGSAPVAPSPRSSSSIRVGQAGPGGSPGPYIPCSPGTSWNGRECVDTRTGLGSHAGISHVGIKNVGVGLGKPPASGTQLAVTAGGSPGPFDPCPPGTTWNSRTNECMGSPIRISVPAGTFNRTRPGNYPVRERASGRTAGVVLVRPDGSGEVPVLLFTKKEGSQGESCGTVCTAEGACFTYTYLPADPTYLTTLPVEDIGLVCGAKLAVPSERESQAK